MKEEIEEKTLQTTHVLSRLGVTLSEKETAPKVSIEHEEQEKSAKKVRKSQNSNKTNHLLNKLKTQK